MEKSEIFPELDKQRRIEDRSQEEMAEEIGISRQSYNNYRTGKTKPNTDILLNMFAYIKDNPKVIMQRIDKKTGETLFLDREEALDLNWLEESGEALPFDREEDLDLNWLSRNSCVKFIIYSYDLEGIAPFTKELEEALSEYGEKIKTREKVEKK